MNNAPEPTTELDQPLSPKVDPETLVLRARPPRAIRFKRGLIFGLTALTSVAIVGTAWVALRPAAFHTVSDTQDRGDLGKVQTDTLNGLPSSYGDAPRLGPPLPGDLGKPILEQQRAFTPPPADTVGADRIAQAAAAERAAQAAQLHAARQSSLLVKAPPPAGASSETSAAPTATAAAGDTTVAGLDPERDPNAQGRKQAFVSRGDRGGAINPHSIADLLSPNVLSAGSVIAASLITGLRSDLPGLVTAQVTEHVYDSATGQILLVPQGARLIGSYDSVVAYGQRRALVVWQRIVLPDGRSLAIDNVPATDPSGYAGLADKVDFHTWSLLKGVALSTLLGVGSSFSLSDESDLVQAIRESTQQNASRASDQITSRNLQVQPTITIRPGAAVRLVVHRDLILAPWRG